MFLLNWFIGLKYAYQGRFHLTERRKALVMTLSKVFPYDIKKLHIIKIVHTQLEYGKLWWFSIDVWLDRIHGGESSLRIYIQQSASLWID